MELPPSLRGSLRERLSESLRGSRDTVAGDWSGGTGSYQVSGGYRERYPGGGNCGSGAEAGETGCREREKGAEAGSLCYQCRLRERIGRLRV